MAMIIRESYLKKFVNSLMKKKLKLSQVLEDQEKHIF